MCGGQKNRSPLHCACHSGKLEVIKFLVEEMRVDSSRQDVGGWAPLHIAALNGQKEAVKLLVERYKCDVDIRDMSGASPRQLARMKGQTDMCSYLTFKTSRYTRHCRLHACRGAGSWWNSIWPQFRCLFIRTPLSLYCHPVSTPPPTPSYVHWLHSESDVQI